jgi:hypothetical protein
MSRYHCGTGLGSAIFQILAVRSNLIHCFAMADLRVVFFPPFSAFEESTEIGIDLVKAGWLDFHCTE